MIGPRHVASRMAAACMLAVLGLSSAGCSLLALPGGERTTVASLTGGEAIAESVRGTIFVTGTHGVYRLRGVDDDPVLEPVPVRASVPAGCQYTGAVARHGWLFTACTTAEHSYLLQGALSGSHTALSQVAVLDGVALASGMAADGRGRLYVADSRQQRAALSMVEITRHKTLRLSTKPWYSAEGTGFPNGVQTRDDVVYLTSAGRLLAIPVRGDGSAGEARVVLARMTFLDDFQVLDGGFLLTDYTFNRLLVVHTSGAGLGSFAASTRGPTAVLVTTGADGKPRVLVTERERHRLSLVRVPASLRRYLRSAARQ